MESTSTAPVITIKPKMIGLCTSALRDRRGAATIEYALLAAMIALAGLVGLAPFGNALSQELSGLSRGFSLTEASTGCRRVEWTDAELRYHVASKHASEPSHLP